MVSSLLSHRANMGQPSSLGRDTSAQQAQTASQCKLRAPMGFKSCTVTQRHEVNPAMSF